MGCGAILMRLFGSAPLTPPPTPLPRSGAEGGLIDILCGEREAGVGQTSGGEGREDKK